MYTKKYILVSDIAVFVLKRDVKLQPTNKEIYREQLYAWSNKIVSNAYINVAN